MQFLRKSDQELQNLSRMDIYKATGRGGQKKNKTSNAIRLSLGNLSVTQSASRSRADNISKAVKKLRLAIALDIGSGFQERSGWRDFPEEILPYLQSDLIRINPKNKVFPIFLGNFIDVFIHHQGNWKKIAEQFNTSNSQIRRFTQENPFMLETVKKLQNQFRIAFDPVSENPA